MATLNPGAFCSFVFRPTSSGSGCSSLGYLSDSRRLAVSPIIGSTDPDPSASGMVTCPRVM